MKTIILIATTAALTEARSIKTKREAFESCFPFCGVPVPTGGIAQTCHGANCKQDNANAGGASAPQNCT